MMEKTGNRSLNLEPKTLNPEARDQKSEFRRGNDGQLTLSIFSQLGRYFMFRSLWVVEPLPAGLPTVNRQLTNLPTDHGQSPTDIKKPSGEFSPRTVDLLHTQVKSTNGSTLFYCSAACAGKRPCRAGPGR